MSNSKKSHQDDTGFDIFLGFLFLMYRLIIIPLQILDFLIKRFTRGRLDNFFEKFVFENIKNQFKIKILNLIILVLGYIFAIPASLLLWVYIFFVIGLLIQPELFLQKAPTLIKISLNILGSIPVLFLALIRNKISKVINSPDYKKSLVGIEAEGIVKDLIQKFSSEKNGWKTYHNILLVFNKGLPNEWSREIDHLLIKNKSVYIVETKYKSGNVYVNKDSDFWQLEHNGRNSNMRNALKQAIKTAEIFDREFNLPKSTAIPIIVIVGNNSKIIDAPTNVVGCEHLEEVIAAFEYNNNSSISTDGLIGLLEKSIAFDEESLKRHIIRAEEKKRQYDFDNIVSGAHRSK